MILPLMPFVIGQLLTLANKVLERIGTEHRAQAGRRFDEKRRLLKAISSKLEVNKI
jgi:hypothetical protein